MAEAKVHKRVRDARIIIGLHEAMKDWYNYGEPDNYEKAYNRLVEKLDATLKEADLSVADYDKIRLTANGE